MSRIRSGNTKPELLVRRFLHAQGFRYKLHGLTPGPSPRGGEGRKKFLPGKPDIVLPKYKTVIFIHACLPVGRAVSDIELICIIHILV